MPQCWWNPHEAAPKEKVTRIVWSGALAWAPSWWIHLSQPLITLMHLHIAMSRPPELSLATRTVLYCWPWCPASLWHPFMATILWAVGTMNHTRFFQALWPQCSTVVIEGTLGGAWNFSCSLMMAIPSSVVVWSPKKCFRSCTLWVEILSITDLEYGTLLVVQPPSPLDESLHVCGWPSLGLQFLQLAYVSFHQASDTTRSWALALPTVPTVTPSRIDFTTSASNFDMQYRSEHLQQHCLFLFDIQY